MAVFRLRAWGRVSAAQAAALCTAHGRSLRKQSGAREKTRAAKQKHHAGHARRSALLRERASGSREGWKRAKKALGTRGSYMAALTWHEARTHARRALGHTFVREARHVIPRQLLSLSRQNANALIMHHLALFSASAERARHLTAAQQRWLGRCSASGGLDPPAAAACVEPLAQRRLQCHATEGESSATALQQRQLDAQGGPFPRHGRTTPHAMEPHGTVRASQRTKAESHSCTPPALRLRRMF